MFCVHFHSVQWNFYFPQTSSWTLELLEVCFLDFKYLRDYIVTFQWLISSLIALWSKDTLCIVSILLNLLRFILCFIIWYILVYIYIYHRYLKRMHVLLLCGLFLTCQLNWLFDGVVEFFLIFADFLSCVLSVVKWGVLNSSAAIVDLFI